MASFSTTFSGGDANPLSEGGVWSTQSSHSALQVVGGRVRPTALGVFNSANVNSPAFGNDQWAQATVVTLSNLFQTNAGVMVRASDAANTYYRAGIRDDGVVSIDRILAGTLANLISTGSGAGGPGSVIKLQITGTQLTAFINSSQVLTIADANIASGRPGIVTFIQATATVDLIELDDFSADDTVASNRTPVVGAALLTGIASRMDLGMTPRSMVKIA